MADATALIEQFVAALNDQGFEPLFEDEVSSELRTKQLDAGGVGYPATYDWKIRRFHANPWITELENKLPSRFPALYRELIAGFRFGEFEVGPIMFLANTGTPVFSELADAIFRDEHLYPTLLKNRFIQFGKQAGGGYDPVCFDMARQIDNDAPVVQLDHEAVLIKQRIRVVTEITPTFKSFVEQVIAG